jgi:ABC-type Mn2+/Zn2+ transport system permease subunit
MFSSFMVNAWEVSGIVAVVAGVVGFFTVLRGSAFAAHAIPNGSFAGAAGASLVGVSTLFGLGVFAFLGVLALATAMTVPVVGTLLIFSLMIGAPAAARSLTDRPGVAMALSVVIALAVVWFAIAASYETDWPVGFFVGTASAGVFVLARIWQWGRERHGRRLLGSVA